MYPLIKHKITAYGLLIFCCLAFLPTAGHAEKSQEEIAAVFYHGHHHPRYYRGDRYYYGYYGRPYYGYPNYYYDDDSFYNERPYYDEGFGVQFRIR